MKFPMNSVPDYSASPCGLHQIPLDPHILVNLTDHVTDPIK